MRRVLEGKLRDPKLTQLKAAINDAKAQFDLAAEDAPEEIRVAPMRKMDLAIADLMEAVAHATKRAAG